VPTDISERELERLINDSFRRWMTDTMFSLAPGLRAGSHALNAERWTESAAH